MMAAITNPISIGWIFGVGPRVTSETLSGSSGSGSGVRGLGFGLLRHGADNGPLR